MLTTISPMHFVLLSGALFAIGLFGAITKKNAISVLICIELMLSAANINLVAFNKFFTPELLTGQVFAIFVIAIAAAEVGLGLAIIIAMYRKKLSVNLDDFNWMKW